MKGFTKITVIGLSCIWLASCCWLPIEVRWKGWGCPQQQPPVEPEKPTVVEPAAAPAAPEQNKSKRKVESKPKQNASGGRTGSKPKQNKPKDKKGSKPKTPANGNPPKTTPEPQKKPEGVRLLEALLEQ